MIGVVHLSGVILLAPTKLYRPIVSVVAALSKRKENLAFDLKPPSIDAHRVSIETYCRDTLRYANVGVRVSAGIVAETGMRLGGFGVS